MAATNVDPYTTNVRGERVLRSFSMAEHDRRFARVQQLMASAGLDCLIVPPTDLWEIQSNSRYLTQVGGMQGGAWAIVPASGAETAILGSEREHKMWRANLEWPVDMRWSNNPFGPVVDRLKELGVERGRVGYAGLHTRPEGLFPFRTWEQLTALLPHVSFVEATDVLDRCRVAKGEEEIAVVQRITDANELAIERMIEVARPGVEESTVWIEMATVMLRATGDYPARLALGSNDAPSNASNNLGLPIRMEDGGILSQEIDARVQGYRAQCNHSILVGGKDADSYRAAMEASIATFQEMVAWTRPGRTVGELLAEFQRVAETHGGAGESVTIHTNGLGFDRPRVGPGATVKDADWRIEPGWTFTVKTHVKNHRSGRTGLVGEPITVSETGARRLGHRDLRPIVTG
jgi:Xaa-Pro aminopeptidase